MRTASAPVVSAAEANSLFSGLEQSPGILLAVSGGPDSTALLWLAARWRKANKSKSKIFAATVDHGLRKEAHREAVTVGKLAKKLGVPHRILKWNGKKPATGLQQNARAARYRLLAGEAKRVGAAHVLTAHTLDDQAETVIMRMARGSGITGLAAMARRSRFEGLSVMRPFLELPKARLVATLKVAKISFSQDPSNRDPKFTRVRLRELMPVLAREGLDARRLAILARRLRRADTALEAQTDRAMAELATAHEASRAIVFEGEGFGRLPAEIALRLAARALNQLGTEGPVELGKLEALLAAAAPDIQFPGAARFRRSLAGALFSVGGGKITVEAAPPRGKAKANASSSGSAKPLTTGRGRGGKRAKSR